MGTLTIADDFEEPLTEQMLIVAHAAIPNPKTAALMENLRQAGPSSADVARAKAANNARQRHRQSSSAALAEGFVAGALSGGPQDDCELDRQVSQVSAADVQRVAEQYFGEGRLHVVAIGPAVDLESRLADLGLGRVRRRDGFGGDASE